MQDRLWRNPYAKIGIPLAFGNKNMVVHTGAESFPWQGTTLAVHLIRFLSVLFGAGTVFLTWKVAREVVGGVRDGGTGQTRAGIASSQKPLLAMTNSLTVALLPLLAAGVVAFNPMFLFISASVNNDALAALLATSAIFLIVQLVTRGVTKVRALALGVLVGLAVMAKVSNLALGPVVLSVFVYLLWKTRDVKGLVIAGVLFLLPIAALTGWWFARNYQLYADPLAFNVWMQIAGGRAPQTLLGLVDEFQGFRISFWGNFGGVNVIAPEWVYTTLDIFSMLAVVGLVIGAVRRTLPFLSWILAVQVIVVFVALVRWTLMTYASQGRLMFPAIAAISILFVFGLYTLGVFVVELLRGMLQTRGRFVPYVFPALLAVFLFGFAVAAPFLLVAPVYATPPTMDIAAPPENQVSITYDAGDSEPELYGFTIHRVMEGNELPITLVWVAGKPLNEDLVAYIHVYDANGERIGQWDAFPGNGLLPTRLWQEGLTYVDKYRVPLMPTDAYPPLARVEVGLSRQGATRPLVARDPQGQEITPTLGRVRTKFGEPKTNTNAGLFRFGDGFELVEFELAQDGRALDLGTSALAVDPGSPLNVTWAIRALKPPGANYKMFLQLVNRAGIVVAQRDAEPANGTFPTSYLLENEVVTDVFDLAIPAGTPPGAYRIIAGMYAVEGGRGCRWRDGWEAWARWAITWRWGWRLWSRG